MFRFDIGCAEWLNLYGCPHCPFESCKQVVVLHMFGTAIKYQMRRISDGKLVSQDTAEIYSELAAKESESEEDSEDGGARDESDDERQRGRGRPKRMAKYEYLNKQGNVAKYVRQPCAKYQRALLKYTASLELEEEFYLQKPADEPIVKGQCNRITKELWRITYGRDMSCKQPKGVPEIPSNAVEKLLNGQ